jgi:hypothetical protein
MLQMINRLLPANQNISYGWCIFIQFRKNNQSLFKTDTTQKDSRSLRSSQDVPVIMLVLQNTRRAEHFLMLFFWVLAPRRLIGRCQRFGETYCFHLQGWRWRQPWRLRQYISPKRWHLPTSLRGAKTQKNSVIILTAVKISNLTRTILGSFLFNHVVSTGNVIGIQRWMRWKDDN